MIFLENPAGVYRLTVVGQDILAAFSSRQFTNDLHLNFLEALGLSPSSLICLKQVHGNHVVNVPSLQQENQEDYIRCEADGLCTNQKGLVLGILTADCVPVFFEDPVKKAVGIAHAGWRGIQQGIVQETLRLMIQTFGSDPQKIRVVFGPAIRSCCYEVGPEFRDLFPRRYFEKDNGQTPSGYVDLVGVIRDVLLKEEIYGGNIYDSEICTSCQNDRFFSARREKGTKERILSIIQILK